MRKNHWHDDFIKQNRDIECGVIMRYKSKPLRLPISKINSFTAEPRAIV
jgi:hypothetical protein